MKQRTLVAASMMDRWPASPLAQRTIAASTEGANGARGARERLRAGLVRFFSGPHVLALADQAVVSGTSFFTTVVIGRWAAPSALGIYALGMSVLLAALGIQEALISLPYTIQRHHPQASLAEHAGSAMAQSGVLSAMVASVLAMAALGLFASGWEGMPVWVACTLACIAPFVLLRELRRQFAFARLAMAQVLLLDSVVAAVQITGLGWLARTGRLSAVTACGTVGAACAATGIAWLLSKRGQFTIRWERVRAATERSWSLGKWLFAGQIMLSVQGSVACWLLAIIAGTAAPGVYTACMSLVMFSNPLILGLGNILIPKTVLALASEGHAGVRREALRGSLLLGVAMALFCVVILLAGEDLVRLLYRNGQYRGHGDTLVVLALAQLAAALGMPASNALASVERPRGIFWTGLFAAALTVALTAGLVPGWGVVGAAYGLLAGNMAGAAGRWIAFLAIIPRAELGANASSAGPKAALSRVDHVLEQLTQTTDDGNWTVRQLDQGNQATIYVARSQSPKPIWRTDCSLVVKLYRPGASSRPELAPREELARREFDSLARVHAALNGTRINGWKVSSPTPVYLCKSPLALVMTVVPGRSLLRHLERGEDMTVEIVESVSRTLVGAMAGYWSLGQPYGELGFDNVLCDVAARELAFVDPGLPADARFCESLTKHWYPASQDLGYLLFDTAATVRRTIGNPDARLRKQMFAEGAVRAFLGTIGHCDDKRRCLDEVHACARAYLKALEASWTPRGAWRVLLRQSAVRRMDTMLGNLRAELQQFGEVA